MMHWSQNLPCPFLKADFWAYSPFRASLHRVPRCRTSEDDHDSRDVRRLTRPISCLAAPLPSLAKQPSRLGRPRRVSASHKALSQSLHGMRAFAQATCLVVAVAASSGVTATVFGANGAMPCTNEVVVSEKFIGKHNVKLTTFRCDSAGPVPAFSGDSTEVCGAQCDTFCYHPAGGGPNEHDCAIISSALIDHKPNLFNVSGVGAGHDAVLLEHGSCKTYFYDLAATQLTYCYSEWNKLVKYLGSTCNAAHGASGGHCIAADSRWMVQVVHA